MFCRIVFILIALFFLLIVLVGAAAITILIREAMLSSDLDGNSASENDKARK